MPFPYRLVPPIVFALLIIACGGGSSPSPSTGDGPPAVVSASPAQAAGTEQTIELEFSNPSGADKILIVQLMVAPNLSSRKSCWIEYATVGKTVRMMDGSAQGKAGDPGPVSNSECTIDAAKLTHAAEGDSLRVSIPVRLAPGVTETQNIFALASAASQHSGWKPVGTWTPIPGATKK